jgi:hypothetical protein
MAKFEEKIAAMVRTSVLDDIIRANRNSNGEMFFVVEDSDPDFGKIVQRYGKKRVFSNVPDAYANMTSERNDICFISGSTTHTLTAMLTISKNRCHFIGDTSGRLYGQSTKITLGVTTAATDVHAVKNVGVRNSFIGIKFSSTNTVTEATSVFGEGGEYTLFRNCSFEGVKLTSDTYAEVLLNSDSGQFFDCTFGTTSTPVVGDKIRPCIITTAGGVAGGVTSSKDVLFENCKFLKHAGGTGTTFVKVAADADVTRGFIEFKDCVFIANKTGSVPAVAIALGASLTASQILLTGSTIAFNCTKIGTGTGIINGTPARVATATIGIQAT